MRVEKERTEKQSPESLTEISRWEMRNLHRDNPGQEFTERIDISLYYAELSIGPVLSIATESNMAYMLKPFQTFTAPIVVAKYSIKKKREENQYRACSTYSIHYLIA